MHQPLDLHPSALVPALGWLPGTGLKFGRPESAYPSPRLREIAELTAGGMLGACGPDAARCPSDLHQPVDPFLWYVTVMGESAPVPPRQLAFLLGPFESKAEAQAQVWRARGLLSDHFLYCDHLPVGVSGLPDHYTPRVRFRRVGDRYTLDGDTHGK